VGEVPRSDLAVGTWVEDDGDDAVVLNNGRQQTNVVGASQRTRAYLQLDVG
jgi:hypothetical protein